MRTSFSKLHILLEKALRCAHIGTGTYQGMNREASGNLFGGQGSIQAANLGDFFNSSGCR
jgi:hypothetical protein